MTLGCNPTSIYAVRTATTGTEIIPIGVDSRYHIMKSTVTVNTCDTMLLVSATAK